MSCLMPPPLFSARLRGCTSHSGTCILLLLLNSVCLLGQLARTNVSHLMLVVRITVGGITLAQALLRWNRSYGRKNIVYIMSWSCL